MTDQQHVESQFLQMVEQDGAGGSAGDALDGERDAGADPIPNSEASRRSRTAKVV